MPSLNANRYFSQIPKQLDMHRSRFPYETKVSTSFNAGLLIPVGGFIEVLPGDTWDLNMSCAVRMATPIHPTFGDAYLDFFAFYCPNRILWDRWRQFLGENDQSHWAPEEYPSIPQTTFPQGGWKVGDVADYLGLPIGQGNYRVSSLPFRAYERIWSEWFRSTAVQDPGVLYTGSDISTGLSGSSGGTVPDGDYAPAYYAVRGGAPLPVDRLHDYFSSALPQPQYGDALTLEAGQIRGDGNLLVTVPGASNPGQALSTSGSSSQILLSPGVLGLSGTADLQYRSGLAVDWTTTVNDLRMFFQTQKMQEKMAIGGSRYRELIHTFFGVNPPDASVQIPEYLGGCRIKLGMQQVLQTSSTDTTSPQGNTAAFSFTGMKKHLFTRSFTEHGIIMVLCCVRNENIYEQRIERKWTRKDLLDYYNPVFANIGNQPIYNRELFYNGNHATNPPDEIFGYQEAWADYRFQPSMVTGYMRPSAPQSLASWNYADKYSATPVLNDAWMRSPAQTNIDRTIAVTSAQTHQFIGEVMFAGSSTRVMPVYSVPGLLDHH